MIPTASTGKPTSCSAARNHGGCVTYSGFRTKSRLLLNDGPPKATFARPPTNPAPTAHATGRHRRDRSLPVGKTRMITISPTTRKTWATLETHPAAPVANSRPDRPRTEYVAYSPEAS